MHRAAFLHGLTACPIVALALGCSSAPSDQADATTGDDVLSDSGSLRVVLQSSPDAVPVRGENQFELTFTFADTGERVEALKLSMLPFMPAMGHGTSTAPRFSDQGQGRYRFDDVVLTMPGLWEFRTTIAGAESDSVNFRFDVK